MKDEKLFNTSGARPYVLRYGITAAPALLTIFGADMRQMLLILGVGVILSGAAHWLLAHFENEDFLSTMWTANRTKLQANKRAKSERERQKQLQARRKEAVEKAKHEGKSIGIVFAALGAVVTVYAALAM